MSRARAGAQSSVSESAISPLPRRKSDARPHVDGWWCVGSAWKPWMHEERGILVRRGGWGLCVEAAHYPGRSCRFPAVANQEWGPQSHKIKKHLYKKLALTPTHIIALHWLHSESEFWSEPERPNLVCWFRCFNFEVMVLDSMTWDLRLEIILPEGMQRKINR